MKKSIIAAAFVAATLAAPAVTAGTIIDTPLTGTPVQDGTHWYVDGTEVFQDGTKWYTKDGQVVVDTQDKPTTESTTPPTTTESTTESTTTNAGTTTTESTKKTELNNAGNNGTKGTTSKSGTIQSSNRQSSVTPATTQTPAPTVQSTAQSAHVGNSSSPRRDVVRPANISKQSDKGLAASAWTPSKGDEISAQAEDFGGNKLPVTGSKDTLGTILTCFGIAFVVWAGLHAIWIITAPRRHKDK